MPDDAKEPQFHLAVCIDGVSFSAQGDKHDVLRLYQEWKSLSGFERIAESKPTFNGPRMVNTPR